MNWSWEKLSDTLGPLAAVLNTRMKSLQSELRKESVGFPTMAAIRTSDATATTLATIPIPVDRVVVIEGLVAARRTGGSSGASNDGAGYKVLITATNDAGTAAIIGAASITTIAEDQAAWAVTVTVSGNSVLVQVAGAANNNVQWSWSGKQLTSLEE